MADPNLDDPFISDISPFSGIFRRMRYQVGPNAPTTISMHLDRPTWKSPFPPDAPKADIAPPSPPPPLPASVFADSSNQLPPVSVTPPSDVPPPTPPLQPALVPPPDPIRVPMPAVPPLPPEPTPSPWPSRELPNDDSALPQLNPPSIENSPSSNASDDPWAKPLLPWEFAVGITELPDGRAIGRRRSILGDQQEDVSIATDPETNQRSAQFRDGSRVPLGPDPRYAPLIESYRAAQAARSDLQDIQQRQALNDGHRAALNAELGQLRNSPHPADQSSPRLPDLERQLATAGQARLALAAERHAKAQRSIAATNAALAARRQALAAQQRSSQEQPTVVQANLDARFGNQFSDHQTYAGNAPHPLSPAAYLRLVDAGDRAANGGAIDARSLAALDQLGLSPGRIRGRVHEGELSFEQGADLQDRYYGLRPIPVAQTYPTETGFNDWLRQNGRQQQYTDAASGLQDVDQVRKMRTDYVDALATQHSARVNFDPADFARARENFVEEPVGPASKVAHAAVETAKDVSASSLGMVTELGGLALRMSLQGTGLPQTIRFATGYDILNNPATLTDQELHLIGQRTLEWTRDVVRNSRRLFQTSAATGFRDSLAQLQDALLNEGSNEKIATLAGPIAIHGAALFKDPTGASAADTPDQYNILKEPQLAELAEGYRRTHNPVLWDSLVNRLSTSVNARQVEDQLQDYITDHGHRDANSWTAHFLSSRVSGAQELFAQIALNAAGARILKGLGSATSKAAKFVPGGTAAVRALTTLGKGAASRWANLLESTGGSWLRRSGRVLARGLDEAVPQTAQQGFLEMGDPNADAGTFLQSAATNALTAPLAKYVDPVHLAKAGYSTLKNRGQRQTPPPPGNLTDTEWDTYLRVRTTHDSLEDIAHDSFGGSLRNALTALVIAEKKLARLKAGAAPISEPIARRPGSAAPELPFANNIQSPVDYVRDAPRVPEQNLPNREPSNGAAPLEENEPDAEPAGTSQEPGNRDQFPADGSPPASDHTKLEEEFENILESKKDELELLNKRPVKYTEEQARALGLAPDEWLFMSREGDNRGELGYVPSRIPAHYTPEMLTKGYEEEFVHALDDAVGEGIRTRPMFDLESIVTPGGVKLKTLQDIHSAFAQDIITELAGTDPGKELLSHSFNAYWNSSTEPEVLASAALKRVQAMDENGKVRFVRELVRQLSQLRAGGEISESVMYRLSQKVSLWINAVLSRMGFLSKHLEEFSPKLAERVNRVRERWENLRQQLATIANSK